MSASPSSAAEVAAPAEAPAVRPRSLRRNMVYAVGGNAFFNLCRFGVVVILAKFATVELQGQYNYAIALTSPIILFFTFNLRGAYVSDARGQFTFGTYHTFRTVGMVLAAIGAAVVIAWDLAGVSLNPFGGSSAPSGDASWTYVAILIFVALAKIIGTATDLVWGVYQRRERLEQLALSMSLQGIGMVLPFVVIVPAYWWMIRGGRMEPERISEGVAWAVAAGAVLWAAAYAGYDLPRTRNQPDCDPAWSWPAVWRLFLNTFPLGVILVLLTLCEAIPRYVIKQRPDGDTALGYFGALSYITMAANLLLIQMCSAAAGRLANFYHFDNRAAFRRLAGKLVLVTIALGLATFGGTWLVGRWFLRVIYTADYATYFPEFLVLVGGQCISLMASTLGIITSQMRRFWIQVPTHVAILIATWIASYALIPADTGNPVRGAAWTVVIRSVVHVALYVLILLGGLRAGLAGARAANPDPP